ncbi:ABI five binding protein [Actinidia rufa]|uniref:Ninja-family protein n=1 Tax=Actinidia rufa TaxID=165716 RepID=A0A7J0ERX1_9ERIC|nr:ABI five binding protein [Actinidia rufa]
MARLLTLQSHHPWPIGAPARPVEGHRAKRKPSKSNRLSSMSNRASSGQFPSRSRTAIAPSAIDCWERISDEIGARFPRASEKEAPIRGSQEIRHHFARFLQQGLNSIFIFTILGFMDLEFSRKLGSSSSGEASLSSIRSLQERSNQEAMGSSGTKGRKNTNKSVTDTESPPKKPEVLERRGRQTGSNSVDNMPCVFTQGDGPNGRRIDGILYKYRKGEEVRIMCVCHGNFLSPAEFVKHAGGTNVAHPLKHIVVNPSAGRFL